MGPEFYALFAVAAGVGYLFLHRIAEELERIADALEKQSRTDELPTPKKDRK